MIDTIAYEDEQLLVVNKPAGIATQTSKLREQDLMSKINNYRKGGYVGLINRLDQQVEGLVLLGKTQEATATLTKYMTQGKMEKYYQALVVGSPNKEDNLIHYLCKESSGNRSIIVDQACDRGKRASLTYWRLEDGQYDLPSGIAAVRIALHTGRHHQIRIQLSESGIPILGDCKYGTQESIALSQEYRIQQVALTAYQLSFPHPKTGVLMEHVITPTWIHLFKEHS